MKAYIVSRYEASDRKQRWWLAMSFTAAVAGAIFMFFNWWFIDVVLLLLSGYLMRVADEVERRQRSKVYMHRHIPGLEIRAWGKDVGDVFDPDEWVELP